MCCAFVAMSLVVVPCCFLLGVVLFCVCCLRFSGLGLPLGQARCCFLVSFCLVFSIFAHRRNLRYPSRPLTHLIFTSLPLSKITGIHTLRITPITLHPWSIESRHAIAGHPQYSTSTTLRCTHASLNSFTRPWAFVYLAPVSLRVRMPPNPGLSSNAPALAAP